MKLLFSTILAIAVVAAAVPLLVKMYGSSATTLDVLGGRGADSAGSEAQATTTGTMYRWRDADGTVHIESEPPPAGIQAEAINFETTKREPKQDEDSTTVGISSGEDITRLLDQAEDTATRLQDRNRTLDELTRP